MRKYWPFMLLFAMVVLPLFLGLAPNLDLGFFSYYYFLNLGFITFVFVAQAVAWNILGGYGGQISFGYSAFFGLGAYTTAVLWGMYHWPMVLTFPVAGLVGVIFAIIIGLPTFRLTGPYFSIATLGIGEAMRVLMLNINSLGGASGMNLPTTIPGKMWFYYAGLILVSGTLAVSAWVRQSKFGLALFALNMDQNAAASLGVNVALYKNLAHMLGAFIVGMSGGLYATYFQYIHPDQVFGFQASISLVLMPVIGGVGTLWGPVLGGTIYYFLEDTLLSSLPSLHLLVYGVLLVLIIVLEPNGLLGMAARVQRWWRARQKEHTVAFPDAGKGALP